MAGYLNKIFILSVNKNCNLYKVKKIYLFIAGIFFVSFAAAQIKSPQEFLGYQLGTRYTPHYKIVSYFQYIAQAAPESVTLQQYGETNEGRPLYVAFVSSKKNIDNLENIRENNLALAHMGNKVASPDAPVIVWLSYNVHGNETSSSEAAMQTLFALTDPSNNQSRGWLGNTVVVIDPCLNPDGRDRYVNWYNTMIGKQWNPLAISREHREEWPGGRSNHYNYDLNRDWVWQTQVESRGRVSLYNKWLPQVHVDFHEQGVNSPYYFAPAAEPYHEVITPWQRDFQKTIGKNNAKYFDKNGWLFFTGIRFDLLYPSYGDTYPLYNGAIGMTYEQGGISAGLGILTSDKDTLTLAERILHHYTSAISTIEISSANARALVKEFQNYFNDASSGKIGDYKTYIIKNRPEDRQRIKALMELMDRNAVSYGTSSGSGKGYNYNTKKEESFTIASNDLVISATQPKSVMVKVLFEPQTKLSDSVTYDITAWSMPYAYGLTAYGSRQQFPVGAGTVLEDFTPNSADAPFGYAIKWQGLNSVKVVGALLKKGIRIRYSEVPFQTQGAQFGRGTILINKTGNARFASSLWKDIADVCNSFQVKMYPVTSGMTDNGGDWGSDLVHVIKPVKVALLTGEGVRSSAAGEIWDYFDNQIEYPLTLINAKDFGRIKLDDFDVLILPAGQYEFLNNKSDNSDLERWIRNGGKVIALESAVGQLATQKWSTVKLKSDSTKKDIHGDIYEDLKIFENRERNEITGSIPGAIYKVDVDNSHPLMFGYPDFYYALKLNADVYEFIKEGKGWNVGYLKKENYMSGYVGYKLTPKLKDGLLYGVQDLGRGSVIYLADDVIFRNFWQTGKLMLANAVFLVGE